MNTIIRAMICLYVFIAYSSMAKTAQSDFSQAHKYLSERAEVYFKIILNSRFDISRYDLGNILSIDRVEFPEVYAYATKDGFEKFIRSNLDYEVLTPPGLLTPVTMSDTYDDGGKGTRFDFYKYPTYSAYVNQMVAWAKEFPLISRLDTLGYTANKKHALLCMKISKDVNKSNGKPKYLSSTSIHGDEVVPYLTTLHMIDTLLRSYGTDKRLTRLVDSIEYYLCPLLNPDATYLGGDNTVSGARRNSVTDNFDLNRNYPCFCGQTNHDKYGLYTKTALETKAMLDIHKKYYFNFISDDHGGIEAMFWPYGCLPKVCCDVEWCKWLAKRFADQVHKDCNNNGYFTSAGGDGIGHWFYEMYEAHGTRVDYQTYFGHGKGMGPETSVAKILEESSLKSRWEYLKEAYFQYMELLFTGIQGVVSDSQTNHPIYGVKMSRNGDFDNADVLSDSLGFYLRFTNTGTYTLTFSHKDYVTKTYQNFKVEDYSKKYLLNVKLWPVNPTGTKDVQHYINSRINIAPYFTGIKITVANVARDARIDIYSVKGILVQTLLPAGASTAVWRGDGLDGKPVSCGCYVATVAWNNRKVQKSFTLNR